MSFSPAFRCFVFSVQRSFWSFVTDLFWLNSAADPLRPFSFFYLSLFLSGIIDWKVTKEKEDEKGRGNEKGEERKERHHDDQSICRPLFSSPLVFHSFCLLKIEENVDDFLAAARGKEMESRGCLQGKLPLCCAQRLRRRGWSCRRRLGTAAAVYFCQVAAVFVCWLISQSLFSGGGGTHISGYAAVCVPSPPFCSHLIRGICHSHHLWRHSTYNKLAG